MTVINVDPATARRVPSVLSAGLVRGRHEIRSFFRSREAMLFGIGFPVMLLVLFSAIFGREDVQPGVPYARVLTAGILASGLGSVTFMSLAIAICAERDAGDLKRLLATPMPKTAYFIGKFIQVLCTMVLELTLVLSFGVLFYGVKLPNSLGRWITFGWVTILGAAACSLLGVAMSSVPRNAKAAAPIVNLPFVALQFISGVFVQFNDLPAGLRTVASFFPLKWIAQGYRSVLLPDSFLAVEPTGSWEHPRTALVLVAWTVGGGLLCARTFRWMRNTR
jgi:ABC-2 type transport system permease protein